MEERFVTDLGEPSWRRVWFDGWDLLRLSVEADVASARWWLWGDFVTNRNEPRFGERGALDAALIVDTVDLADQATGGVDIAKLTRLAQARASAEDLHRVDVHGIVYQFPEGDARAVTAEAFATKLTRRASRNIAHESEEYVDAGYIEVLP